MQRHLGRLDGLLGCVVIAASLAGCLVEPADHKVWNRAGESIEVLSVQDGKERVLIDALEANRFYPLNYGEACPELVLVARTTTGTEVARRTGPFCASDEWVVEWSSQQSSVPTRVPEITPTPVPT